MSLPVTDNQELFVTGYGSESIPIGISAKGYLWSVSQSFGKLLIKEFYSSFVASIPLSLYSFSVSPALQNDGSFFTDRFWVWCIGTNRVLRILEIEPNLTTDPTTYFSRTLSSDVSSVGVYIREHDDVRLLVLSDSLPKSLSIKMYHDVKVSSPISTSVNWNSSRLDNFSNFVSSDSTQFSISYSYAASPYSAYTEDYSIPIPSIISLTQILSSADIQAVWSVSVGSDGYVLERSSEPLFLSPIEIYSGPLTTFTESSVPVGTFYYRVRAANTLVSLISLWSVVESIVVISPIVADFISNPLAGYAPLTVNFTDTSTGTPTSWNWDFGDGSTHATTQNPTHIYTVAGTYTVTLIASNIGGSDTEIKTNYITVSMVADFTGTPTLGPANLSVAFTDTSTGTPTSWDWDFGDGSTHATTQNPTHIYTVTGTYTVTLIATNAGGSDTEIKTDYITVIMTADFTGTPTSGPANLSVAFTDTSTGTPTSWDWDFGDGSTHATTQNPTHIYTVAGTYTVTLIATNGAGSDTETKTSYISVSMVANFTGTPTSGPANLSVAFTDTSTGTPTSWDWDFGDGSTHATTQNPTHIYTVAGTYTVTLIATNGAGSDTETKTSYISVSMVANFTGTPTSGPANLSVAFTDTSTGTPTSWDWDFGDGSTHATTQNPTHIYTVAGTYTVTLIATNGAGSNTKIKTDYIVVGLLVDFSATPVKGRSPLFVRFSDLTIGNPTTWAWSFGDGETSSLKNPVHLYNSAGVYTVSLTASNLSASGTRTRVNYITATFYRVSTEDIAPPADRVDLRTMYGEGAGTYRYPKKGVQISTVQGTATESGFTRPNGPTLILG